MSRYRRPHGVPMNTRSQVASGRLRRSMNRLPNVKNETDVSMSNPFPNDRRS